MNKVLKRLDSAAGNAVTNEVSASVDSLYRLKVEDGFRLSFARQGAEGGGDAAKQQEETEKGR